MFDAATRSSLRAAFEQTFALLGTPATWRQAKAPHATKAIEIGIKTAGPRDDVIINTYGVGAKIITMKASDFTTTLPEQFDELVVGNEKLVLAAVHPVNIGNAVVFFKGYVRGKRVV